jgi:DNA-binding protein H-NS
MYKIIQQNLRLHREHLEHRPNFTATFTKFSEILILYDNYCFQIENDTESELAYAEVCREEAIQHGTQISSQLVKYAKDTDNRDLVIRASISKSKLRHCARENCLRLLDTILLHAYKHIFAIDELTSEMVQQLQSERDSLAEQFNQRKLRFQKHRELLASAKHLSRELDELLKSHIDPTVKKARRADKKLFLKHSFCRDQKNYNITSYFEAKNSLLVEDDQYKTMNIETCIQRNVA